MVFVPLRFATDAVYESVDAGIETVICIAEGLPAHEMLRHHLQLHPPEGHHDARPELPRAPSPRGRRTSGSSRRRSSARADRARQPLRHFTYQIGHELTQLGLGNSTIVGIGGDPVVGSNFIDVLAKFEADEETEIVVMVGEIGGAEEEEGRRSTSRRGQARRRVHRRLHGAGKTMGHAGLDHLRHLQDRPGEGSLRPAASGSA